MRSEFLMTYVHLSGRLGLSLYKSERWKERKTVEQNSHKYADNCTGQMKCAGCTNGTPECVLIGCELYYIHIIPLQQVERKDNLQDLIIIIVIIIIIFIIITALHNTISLETEMGEKGLMTTVMVPSNDTGIMTGWQQWETLVTLGQWWQTVQTDND